MEAVALLSCHLKEYNRLNVLNALHHFCTSQSKATYTFSRAVPTTPTGSEVYYCVQLPLSKSLGPRSTSIGPRPGDLLRGS